MVVQLCIVLVHDILGGGGATITCHRPFWMLATDQCLPWIPFDLKSMFVSTGVSYLELLQEGE